MDDKAIFNMMPTGIPSLDPVMGGGVPPGSLVLLFGDIGAGGLEFAYTSAMLLSRDVHERSQDTERIPREIWYVTFTKGRDDVLSEMKLAFHPDLARGIDEVKFIDLSQIYFDSSIVPLDWYSEGDLYSRLQARGGHDKILGALATRLSTIPEKSLIIFDSLTDLATQYAKDGLWSDFAAFLRGLQRVAKE